jgi:ATP-dependent RNA helicase HelY
VIDVLGQIAAAAPVSGVEGSSVSKAARKAVDLLLRGVVAYSSVG